MREFFKIYGPITATVIVGFIVAYQFVNPAPPRTLTLAAGSPGGAYTAYARRYAEILSRDGITVTIRETAGTVENLALLRDESSGVDVAFVQGGVGQPEPDDGLQGLGSVYFEPLWVFTRRSGPFGGPIVRLSELKGRRIAVGGEGSGTRAIALLLLAANGVTGETADLLPVSGDEALNGLLNGTIDAAFLVTGKVDGPVTALATARDVDLMSFDQAEAYAARFRFLSATALPKGAISLEKGLPESRVALLAPAATLVATDRLHPALVDLLLQAAREVHGDGGLFEAAGQFPSPRFLDFPLSSDAKRYYESGTRFLRKYLPFWAATLVERLLVMLLPFFTLLIPLLRIAPPTYRWRIRMKIYRWYEKLRAIEAQARASLGENADNANADARGEILAQLDVLQDEAGRVNVPLAYAEHLYHLRLHIDFVRKRIAATEPQEMGRHLATQTSP